MKINKILLKILILYFSIFFVLFTALYLLMPFSFENYWLITFLNLITSTLLICTYCFTIQKKSKKTIKTINDCDTIYLLSKRFPIIIYIVNFIISNLVFIIFKHKTARVLSIIAMFGTTIFYIFSCNYFKAILEYSEKKFRAKTLSIANINRFYKDIPESVNLVVEILSLIILILLIGLSLGIHHISCVIYIISLTIISTLSVIYISLNFYNNINKLSQTISEDKEINYYNEFSNLAYKINTKKQTYDNYIEQLITEQNLKLEQERLSSIEIIRRTVDAKDAYTRGHSDRVSEYSVLIGKKLGLSDQDLYTLKIGALFHDIGKIGIPDRVLLKEGKLTDEEYEEIKKHPSIGAHILENSNIFENMIPIVLHHHERFDGRGYPMGLKNKEIPLMARIVAVADTFDAMTSKRVYRNSLPLDVVKAEFERCSGTQFDSEIVKIFLDILNNEYNKIDEIKKL